MDVHDLASEYGPILIRLPNDHTVTGDKHRKEITELLITNVSMLPQSPILNLFSLIYKEIYTYSVIMIVFVFST
jgi:hypothetical protein